MKPGQFGSIIWDWNGTLLNDMHLCVQTMNELLIKRNLSLMSLSSYQEVFSFPVKDYYRKIGFDFEIEPFEIPAMEFIDGYNQQVFSCLLHQDALSVLRHFHSFGIRQFILSAMHQDVLDDCLKHYQIDHFFEHVRGLDNHFAASKTANGQQLIAEFNLNTSDLVLIGDTVHDFEVASKLGCSCILIANGHQSKAVLESTGAQLIDTLIQLLD